MKAVSILALAAGVRAATAPLCKACEQSECLDCKGLVMIS